MSQLTGLLLIIAPLFTLRPSLCWFSGLMTCAAASHLHSLPLLYLGYGGLGGAAWGLLYMTPVSATMKWFPDRRGLATGLTLSAFGAGAAIAPPLIDFFTTTNFVAPEFVGAAAEVALTTLPDGSQCLSSDSSTKVVVATATDAAKVGLPEGVYKLGTGDSGATGAFASLACIYGGVSLACSQFMKGKAFRGAVQSRTIESLTSQPVASPFTS